MAHMAPMRQPTVQEQQIARLDELLERLESAPALHVAQEQKVKRLEKKIKRLEAELEGTAEFETDCKTVAAGINAAHLRRGHLLVDNELLLEHWWASSGEKIIDMSLRNVRGHLRTSKNVTLEYLPIDPEGTFFDGEPWTGCMQTWGDCSLPKPCDWCAARYTIISRLPQIRPGQIVVGFSPPNVWDRLLGDGV